MVKPKTEKTVKQAAFAGAYTGILGPERLARKCNGCNGRSTSNSNL